MISFLITELTILQIVLCFSILTLVCVLIYKTDKSFSKLFGLSFLAPFVLGLLCMYYPEPFIRKMLMTHLNLFSLIAFLFAIISWSRQLYDIGRILIFCLPVFAIVLIMKVPFQEAFSYSPFLLSAILILIIAFMIYVLRVKIKERDISLTWGILILGLFQATYYAFPKYPLFLVVAGEFGAYLLLFSYILKKHRDPLIARMKKAEAKLADMNKKVIYDVKKRLVEVERHNEHLLNMVQRDPLVDAYNKKGIMSIIQEMVNDPSKEPFTIMLFDVDNFKGINDSQGHVVGDMILKKIAALAKGNLRGFDMLGRYGGDEFIIVLPGTTLSDAMFVAERFRKRVSSESEVSVSIGVAAFPEDGDTVKKLIEMADSGLYKSKRIGKNAVSHHPVSK